MHPRASIMTCMAWTDDYEMCLVGSESGDFVYCVFPDKKNISVGDSVSACAGGVHSIIANGSSLSSALPTSDARSNASNTDEYGRIRADLRQIRLTAAKYVFDYSKYG